LVICHIQFYLGKYNISKYLPNIILIIIVYTALSKGALQAEIMGFIFGITLDIFSTNIFGLKAISFTILGYSFGKLFINFNLEQIFIQSMIVLLANIVYLVIISTIYYLYLSRITLTNCLHSNSTLISIMLTIILAPIMFKLFDLLNKIINK
jgi:rod shape-determining protein MreD